VLPVAAGLAVGIVVVLAFAFFGAPYPSPDDNVVSLGGVLHIPDNRTITLQTNSTVVGDGLACVPDPANLSRFICQLSSGH